MLDALDVDAMSGLSSAEAAERLQSLGANELRSTKIRKRLAILLAQLKSIVIWLLIAATAVSLLFGDFVESLAIAAVVAINTAIGFLTELRAVRSIEALRKLGRVETTVRRDRAVQSVPAEMIVPGDIVLIESGDVITADMRLIEAAKLACDESTLTGESVPVSKQTDPLPADTHMSERSNIVFKSTTIVRGSGLAVVTGTGRDTELGKISELVLEAEAADTPLERRLDALARRLVWITAIIAVLVGGSGVMAGRETWLSIQVAIALAVAAIPEGLPIVATIALARGMWRMARRKALVAKLSAVETLGATSVILTDKTGTLTENRMTVTELVLPDLELSLSGTGLDLEGALSSKDGSIGPGERRLAHELLETAALCNNAAMESEGPGRMVQVVGDPTEIALLVAAAKLGIRREKLLSDWPEVAEEPFDPATRAMATYHRRASELRVAVKGAPEVVIEVSVAVRTGSGDRFLDEAARRQWLNRSHALGARGLRTLAIACKRVDGTNAKPYRDLVLLGLVGIHDPPRAGIAKALADCRDAGISVVMVTGDHAATARRIAEELDLIDSSAVAPSVLDGRVLADTEELGAVERERFAAAKVIARASPEQKLKLIELHQRRGHVVAMTGDGVNDAPALKKADIGVAMGQRGTQVAKESAAMVLQDDRFETIVEAVAQGRAIYMNIRKFVVYLMSCNLSEILIVGLAMLVSAPLPLLPLQILFLNLVTDVFPALALGIGEGPPGLMRRKPRAAREPLLTSRHWRSIAVYGVVMSVAVLVAMVLAIRVLGFDDTRAVTVSFLTLSLAQLWHVFNMRDDWRRPLNNEIVRNPWVWGALALCMGLIIAAVYLPGVSGILSLTHPGLNGWVVALTMSVLPLLFGPLIGWIRDPH